MRCQPPAPTAGPVRRRSHRPPAQLAGVKDATPGPAGDRAGPHHAQQVGASRLHRTVGDMIWIPPCRRACQGCRRGRACRLPREPRMAASHEMNMSSGMATPATMAMRTLRMSPCNGSRLSQRHQRSLGMAAEQGACLLRGCGAPAAACSQPCSCLAGCGQSTGPAARWLAGLQPCMLSGLQVFRPCESGVTLQRRGTPPAGCR